MNDKSYGVPQAGPCVAFPVAPVALRYPSTREHHNAQQHKGFTLIELLIVVVIIGILAAIAIPKFSSVKQKGYKTQAIAELQSLKTAEETFFTDSNRYGADHRADLVLAHVVGRLADRHAEHVVLARDGHAPPDPGHDLRYRGCDGEPG